jgi:hypothetical protein
MSVVARVLVMLFAYVVACITAAAVFTVGILGVDWNSVSSATPVTAVIVVIAATVAAIMGYYAALPTALVIVFAEAFGWRSALLYAAAGGALALALSYGFGPPNGIDTITQPEAFGAIELRLLAASGIAGGLVYWLFAGRRAGSWK